MIQKHDELCKLAEDALSTFEKIEAEAKGKLESIPNNPNDSFAAVNTFMSNATGRLSAIQRKNRDGYLALLSEPAIARVCAEDEDGLQKIYYISRNTNIALSGSAQLASYNSPIGRLASLPLGEEKQLRINNENITFYILGKVSFKPNRDSDGWDSAPSQVQDESLGNCTIESLRQLLAAGHLDISDELDALMAGDSSDGVSKGLAHQIRTSMALRDQPILDQFQDEIFRLPLNSQLVILGPPGTGKTTTLIKRLGQKLDREYLDEREQLVAIDGLEGQHSDSWLMFTPSDLLKHYVKEAFNRESVPASDERIKTWKTYRSDVARNLLGILKTPAGGKFLISPHDPQYLHSNLVIDPRDWYEKLAAFHCKRIAKQLSEGLEIVNESCPKDKEELFKELKTTLGNPYERELTLIFSGLDAIEKKIVPIIQASKVESDDLIKKARNLLYNKNNNVFDELAIYLSSLQDESNTEDEEELFDEDAEQLSQSNQSVPDRKRGLAAYIGAIRSLARYTYRKRSVPKNSKTEKIRDWLKDRLPSDEVLAKIGQEIAFQNGLRRFINASRRYVSEVPNSFRFYRKLYLDDDAVYQDPPKTTYHIDATELDAMILLMLRNTRELLMQQFVARNIEEPKFSMLATISSRFKTQIVVDEATDFSVLQLACMEALTRIESRSFFACGDFNQRITVNGIRSFDQLQWVSPSLREQKITTVYRQSQALNIFARKLLEVQGGDLTAVGQLPKNVKHPGVQPVLTECSSSLADVVEWLANRIAEVQEQVRQMPTIAILVNGEDKVKPMANALSERLEEQSLLAVACLEGQILGQGTDVRVFDVQHIKGLEFEAVFFVGVDQLAGQNPELFDRYLYVGATRAATYLGLTCHNNLPNQIGQLRAQFVEKWL